MTRENLPAGHVRSLCVTTYSKSLIRH